MPTASGHDRNNISTTTNFSQPNSSRRSESNLANIPNSNVPNRKQINRILASQESPRVNPDASYVYIPDQRLREIVQKLVISEQDRIVNKIDPKLVTHINHGGYSLFFSRTGANPFEVVQPQVPPLDLNQNIQQQQQVVPQNQTQNQDQNGFNYKTQPDTIVEENFKEPIKQEQENLPTINAPPNNRTVTSLGVQTNEPVNIVYNDKPNLIVSPSPVVVNDEIPPEVNRVIQQDLAKNPLIGSERTYRIVLNKNKSNPGEEPRVVRVVVRAQNYQKLPQLPQKYLVQQNPQYLPYAQPEPTVILKQPEPTVIINSNDARFMTNGGSNHSSANNTNSRPK